MGDLLAMAEEGTSFSADGLNIAWGAGGPRKVQRMTDAQRSRKIDRAIAEGRIVEVTDEEASGMTEVDGTPASPLSSGYDYPILRGEAARKVLAEPPGPVVIRQAQRGGGFVDITLPEASRGTMRQPRGGLGKPTPSEVRAVAANLAAEAKDAERGEARATAMRERDQAAKPAGVTVPELQEQLKAAGLPTSGTKAELVSRLAAAQAAGPDPDQAPTSEPTEENGGDDTQEPHRPSREEWETAGYKADAYPDSDEAWATWMGARSVEPGTVPTTVQGQDGPTGSGPITSDQVPIVGGSPTARRQAVAPQQG